MNGKREDGGRLARALNNETEDLVMRKSCMALGPFHKGEDRMSKHVHEGRGWGCE